jgi:transcriptional regulator with XRE-family HTH domain
MTTIPAQLQSARNLLSLTTNQAAERCGVSRATWYAWEAGKTVPPIAVLERVAEKLGYRLEITLLVGKGSNP